jgi:hypothetical protein
MRTLVVLRLALVCVTVCVHAGANPQVNAVDPQVRFAEKAVVDALSFRQGDSASLVDIKPSFTDSGWADFLKRLTGFVDPQGAPTFTSAFTPSGPPIATKQDRASLTITVPGVLRHESTNTQGSASTTSYRAEIDVRVSPTPFKIEALVQRTCGGATTKTSCR